MVDADKLSSSTEQLHCFRWAHANANSFLYGVFILVAGVVGAIALLVEGDESRFHSGAFWFVGGVLALFGLLVPRFGFYLARFIAASFIPDASAWSYQEYRLREKTGAQETKP